MKKKSKVIIIGAGPASLTAAYELLDKSKDYDVTVLEESAVFGGISRTVNYKGNRMDMGGHRFFSKVPEVNEWWEKMLPTQGFSYFVINSFTNSTFERLLNSSIYFPYFSLSISSMDFFGLGLLDPNFLILYLM